VLELPSGKLDPFHGHIGDIERTLKSDVPAPLTAQSVRTARHRQAMPHQVMTLLPAGAMRRQRVSRASPRPPRGSQDAGSAACRGPEEAHTLLIGLSAGEAARSLPDGPDTHSTRDYVKGSITALEAQSADPPGRW
jgi:hypothetical protein